MAGSKGIGAREMLLEAEVAPNGQPSFQHRYLTATGQGVSPGNPMHYQHQENKWGAELRVYFNDADLAAKLLAKGMSVEERQSGYLSGEYMYRVSNNEYWWELVEHHGYRLGYNHIP